MQHENHFDVAIHNELHHIEGDHFVNHGKVDQNQNMLLNMSSYVRYLEQIRAF